MSEKTQVSRSGVEVLTAVGVHMRQGPYKHFDYVVESEERLVAKFPELVIIIKPNSTQGWMLTDTSIKVAHDDKGDLIVYPRKNQGLARQCSAFNNGSSREPMSLMMALRTLAESQQTMLKAIIAQLKG